MSISQAGSVPQQRLYEVAVLTTLLVTIYAFLIPQHEPWFDEAQAWLLARDSSLSDLLANRLRYEGHPCLWYLALRLPIGFGLPYAAMNWLSAAFSVMGAIVFWRYAPLPRLFRILFPFTFFLFYQFGVVARSYALLPVLMFLFCTLFPDRLKKPIPFTLTLAAMAQVSVHSALIALCWWLLYLKESRFPLTSFWNDRKQPAVQAAMIFVMGGLFLVYTLVPASDILRPDFFDKDTGTFLRMIFTMWNGPLTEIWPLSLGIFAASLFWFRVRGMLQWYLVPTIVLWLFFGALYGKAWHEGVVFCLWLSAVWLSFLPREGDTTPTEAVKNGRVLMHAAMACLLGFHLQWSLSSAKFDYEHPYSGSKALAEYLKLSNLEKSSIIATQFFSPAILPYFQDNIFLNFNKGKRPSFFWWSNHYSFNDSHEYIDKTAPDLVIVAYKFPDSSPHLTLPNYEKVGAFPGDLYFKDRKIEPETFVLYRRTKSNSLTH